MTAVTKAQLISQGATCSICGNSFSTANEPKITTLETERYGGNTVESAVCTIPPYIEKHSNNTVLIYYQTAASVPAGFITIMRKDLD